MIPAGNKAKPLSSVKHTIKTTHHHHHHHHQIFLYLYLFLVFILSNFRNGKRSWIKCFNTYSLFSISKILNFHYPFSLSDVLIIIKNREKTGKWSEEHTLWISVFLTIFWRFWETNLFCSAFIKVPSEMRLISRT